MGRGTSRVPRPASQESEVGKFCSIRPGRKYAELAYKERSRPQKGRAQSLLLRRDVGVKKLEELIAWRVAREFKLEVYRVVRDNQAANGDLRLRSQLLEAAASVESNVAEGFERFSAGDFRRFLSFARASARESLVRLQDGVDRGHFTETEIAPAAELGHRTIALIAALKNSLGPFVGKKR